jgi:hypothetical protein
VLIVRLKILNNRFGFSAARFSWLTNDAGFMLAYGLPSKTTPARKSSKREKKGINEQIEKNSFTDKRHSLAQTALSNPIWGRHCAHRMLIVVFHNLPNKGEVDTIMQKFFLFRNQSLIRQTNKTFEQKLFQKRTQHQQQ